MDRARFFNIYSRWKRLNDYEYPGGVLDQLDRGVPMGEEDVEVEVFNEEDVPALIDFAAKQLGIDLELTAHDQQLVWDTEKGIEDSMRRWEKKNL